MPRRPGPWVPGWSRRSDLNPMIFDIIRNNARYSSSVGSMMLILYGMRRRNASSTRSLGSRLVEKIRSESDDLRHHPEQRAVFLFRRVDDVDLVRNAPQECLVDQVPGFQVGREDQI